MRAAKAARRRREGTESVCCGSDIALRRWEGRGPEAVVGVDRMMRRKSVEDILTSVEIPVLVLQVELEVIMCVW